MCVADHSIFDQRNHLCDFIQVSAQVTNLFIFALILVNEFGQPRTTNVPTVLFFFDKRVHVLIFKCL